MTIFWFWKRFSSSAATGGINPNKFSALSNLFSKSQASPSLSSTGQAITESKYSSHLVTGSSSAEVMSHFVKILTKGGRQRDDIVARVNSKLRQRYGVEFPMQIALEAVKPVLKYQRFKHSRQYFPIVLHGKSAEGIAIRWIVDAAHNKEYLGKRDLERGLYDEIDGILLGNSAVYQKRFNFHRNPN